ncbi:hypothetical protein LEP1GSC116_1092, partial [Leptospira interrogans serovar Icterohaemorrhagiae str. Verdun HP]
LGWIFYLGYKAIKWLLFGNDTRWNAVQMGFLNYYEQS